LLRYACAVGSLNYRARQPEEGALHQIVRDHYATFRTHVVQARDGHGLPRFAERAFEDDLTCGPSAMLRAAPSTVEGWRAPHG